MARTREYSTEKRKLILDFLKKHSDEDVSVKDIENYLCNENDINVNLTTIYRYLEKLERSGSVLKHSDEKNKKTTFQYVVPDGSCHEHLHMKCSVCGKIYHMDCEFMEEFKKHIEQHHGFKLECKNSMLYGLCSNCK